MYHYSDKETSLNKIVFWHTSHDALSFFLMKKSSPVQQFYAELKRIMRQEGEPDRYGQITALYRTLQAVFIEATQEDKIHFTTLFARISYACPRAGIDNRLQIQIHAFRKGAEDMLKNPGKISLHEADKLYELGLYALSHTISRLYGEPIPDSIAAALPPENTLRFSTPDIVERLPYTRIVALADSPAEQCLLVRDETNFTRQIQVRYQIPERNENFENSIHAIRNTFGFPVTLSLINVDIDKEGVYRPRAFVVEPDYLVDVTAVAECFKDHGTEPLLYLLKKFLPFESSPALMLGNVANYILDELMTQPDISFEKLIPGMFQLDPLGFCLLDDGQVRDMLEKSRLHYEHILCMVRDGFLKQGIDPNHCYLEPSFYSPQYGLQGRLDVYYQHPDDPSKAAIVELKSGKPFKTNAYGINHNHFTQTLLYDLLLKSAFGYRFQPQNFILYSSASERGLRYAPTIRAQQFEALQVRNQLVAIEWELSAPVDPDARAPHLFDRLKRENFSHLKGFEASDIASFETLFQGLSPLERAYFISFSAFVAREHRLAKTGIHGIENANGVASLWLNDLAEKEENFDIIRSLVIRDNRSTEDDPVIVFEKTAHSNRLANFRIGDIAVLYPTDAFGGSGILHNQLFKSTVIDIQSGAITVRLRSKQFNKQIFEKNPYWNIEHDLLDSSFTGMYRSLFEFLRAPKDKRDLLFTLQPPRPALEMAVEAPSHLTAEQQAIFSQMIRSQDYFLLWGPPGTGKTSIMLQKVVAWLMHHTTANLLLLAYTNRAVDEITEAVEPFFDSAKGGVLRIGSRYGTDPRFHHLLLEQQSKNIRSRSELRNIIGRNRIVVATVASMAGKMELLRLKKFDRIIIDEASQILEPMLMGLLPHFGHFTLIGDHRQLPAVVVQDASASKTNHPVLESIGLDNLRHSLFERLYRRCREQGWNQAHAQLSHQGRMHEEIMAFPGEHFYEKALKILPGEPPHPQQEALNYVLTDDTNEWERIISSRRVLFLPVVPASPSSTTKTNDEEARLVSELTAAFRRLYADSGLTWDQRTLGIITPWRAQIARIRREMETNGLSSDDVTVDTVERYQGGARDIIIISLCANKASQLNALISPSSDGIDRKLNVALTRARKHLIVIGNPHLLSGNETYRKLMAWGTL